MGVRGGTGPYEGPSHHPTINVVDVADVVDERVN
jgi:hypothetical protein